MSANDTGWISLAPQGQPAGSPTQPAPTKPTANDSGWIDTNVAPPVTAATQSPTAGLPQTLAGKAENLVGSAVEATPGAGKTLEFLQKYAVDPFEKLAAKGAEVGRIGTEGLVQAAYPELTPEETERQHPLATGIARGVGATAGGIVADPRNWPFMAKAAVRPILDKLMSAGFTAMMTKGAHDSLVHLAENWDNMSPAERAESATQSGLTTALATATALHTTGGAIDATKAKFQDALTPEGYKTKQVGPAAVPVRPTGVIARAAEARAPEVAQQFLQEQTAPAIAKGVSQTIQEATGIEGQHPLTTEDPYGLSSMADKKAKEYQGPVQRIDALSDNSFSNAQMERERVKNDFSEAGKEAWKMQTKFMNDLWDIHRPQLEAEGVDVDAAKKAWGQKAALDQIEKSMRKTTEISADPERPYDLKAGKTLGTTIKGLLQHDDAPFQKLFGSKYAEAKPKLEEFARTLNEQSRIAGKGDTPFDTLMTRLSRKIIMDAVGGAVGTAVGGPVGGFVGIAAGHGLDRLTSEAAKMYLGKILSTPKAAELVTNSLKLNADPEKTGEQLKTILHNSDPSWTDTIAQKLSELWHSTTGEAGLPGTVKSNAPVTLHHWSNEDITETDPAKFGTGKAGAERARSKEPGFLPRTYFADEAYKEPAIQGQKYHYTTQVDPTKFYDIAKDPEGIWQEGLRTGGPTAAENAVHDAGYTGYQHDGGYVSFEKHAVTPVGKPTETPDVAVAGRHNENGGSSYLPKTGDLKDGYSVGIRKDLEQILDKEKITPEDVAAYRARPEVAEVLKTNPNAFIGTWVDGGKTYLDTSIHIPDLETAKRIGANNKQLAIFDLKNKQSIDLPVGTKSGAAQDTALFQQAKKELGPDASFSQVAMRAQELKTAANASGESAASLEAQSRLKAQQAQGLRVFDVDSRMAGSKAGWNPVPATVDRIDQQAQPFHHIVSIDKDGAVKVLSSGEGAKPLPADDHVLQLTKAAEEAPAPRPNLSTSEIGTRYPSSANAVLSNDPSMTTGIEALNEADRQSPARVTQAGKPVLGIKQKLVAALADYKDNGVSQLLDASDPDAAIEKYIEHVKGNLKWLHDAMPEAIRGVARHWYESAHDMTKKIAQDNDITHEQSAAVTAALSPKNDWNNNVGQAQRLIEHYSNDQQHGWTPEMDKTLSEIRNGGAISAPLQRIMDTVRGKTYDQLTAKTPEALLAKKAIWFRVLDEAHGAKDTPIYGPDGTVRGSQTLNWGQVDPIAKALSILEDGSLENINAVMGEGHKIRNFYNNIINPWSKRGHTTIDTHAVGAGFLKPFSQEDVEVAHNFGSGNKAGTPSPAKHAATGLKGSYSVHEEAYRRAAAELGLQPRELQSITWEGIRSLMGESKKTPELRRAVAEIWRAHENGGLTLPEAREKILEQAGGFAKPAWMSDSDWERNPTEEGETGFEYGK